MSNKPAPLLPMEDAREAALFFVVCALCFLAALAGLSARSAYSAAEAWTSEVTGQITIRVEGETEDRDAVLEAVRAHKGIATAKALSHADAEELLRPWLGASGMPDGLPLPFLIAAESAPGQVDVGKALRAMLTNRGFDTTVDDHVQWSRDVERATGSARWIALGAVALLVATAFAVIAFATHSALLARAEVVDVLHLCGATDSFIAGVFERRFLGLGLQAGFIGAVLAFAAAAFLLFLAKQAGDKIWLLPHLTLSRLDGLILGLTPLAAGAASMLAARITVVRALAAKI